MQIDVQAIPEMTIEEFADKHGLVMVVRERALPAGHPSRYYARFKGSDIKGDGVLIGTFGNGSTHDAAIAAYAQCISLKRLVIDAFLPTRREIEVPRLRGVWEQAAH